MTFKVCELRCSKFLAEEYFLFLSERKLNTTFLWSMKWEEIWRFENQLSMGKPQCQTVLQD